VVQPRTLDDYCRVISFLHAKNHPCDTHKELTILMEYGSLISHNVYNTHVFCVVTTDLLSARGHALISEFLFFQWIHVFFVIVLPEMYSWFHWWIIKCGDANTDPPQMVYRSIRILTNKIIKIKVGQTYGTNIVRNMTSCVVFAYLLPGRFFDKITFHSDIFMFINFIVMAYPHIRNDKNLWIFNMQKNRLIIKF
jgi:hypothetical protein